MSNFTSVEEDFMPWPWKDCKQYIPGLQSSIFYLESPYTFFAPHVLEDMDDDDIQEIGFVESPSIADLTLFRWMMLK